MSKIPIPTTLGRLAQTCDIYATLGGNLDYAGGINQIFNTTDLQTSSSVDPLAFINSLVAMLATSKRLGAVSSIEVSQIRDIERIYSIGTFAYEPYRLIPHAIKTELTLKKIMVYKGGDMLESTGFPGYNLYQQQAPFIIRQHLLNPNNKAEDVDILYFDCWMQNNPSIFDLDSQNNLVSQSIKVTCGRVFVNSASVFKKIATVKSTRKDVKF